MGIALTPHQIIPQDMLRKYIMYAKEKVRPKLHNLDQEKLSRLYADLRRESLATGSFPITVRHLESMIRMSEASAKMNLREYVRSDDIDLAIQVTVASFVSAQKMSIKKTLERVSCLTLGKFGAAGSSRLASSSAQGFRKYLNQATDHEELLAFILGQLVKEKALLYSNLHGEQAEQVSIKLSELNERVRPFSVSSFTSNTDDYPSPARADRLRSSRFTRRSRSSSRPSLCATATRLTARRS